MHAGEYNRVKTWVDGIPRSSAIHYQDFHRTEGVGASFDNANGLYASKSTMLFDKLKLSLNVIYVRIRLH